MSGFSGAAADNTPWTSYTPASILAASGAFTTVSAVGRYKIVGKTMFLEVAVTVTAVGTAASYIKVSLPPGVTLTGTQAMCYADSNVLFGAAQANSILPAVIIGPSAAIGNLVYHATGAVEIA